MARRGSKCKYPKNRKMTKRKKRGRPCKKSSNKKRTKKGGTSSSDKKKQTMATRIQSRYRGYKSRKEYIKRL